MKLFLYGTLTDLLGLGRCAGRPLRGQAVPAVLPGYRRVLLRGARYPTLRRSPGHAVHGLILRVNADMLVRLRNYESLRYRLVNLRLTTPHGPARARCFIGDAATRVFWQPNEKLMTLRSRNF